MLKRGTRLLALVVPVLALGASIGVGAPAQSGRIIRFAGNGSFGCLSAGCGAGGPATAAQLDTPSGVALDGHRNAYIADGLNNVVWKVSPAGRITRFAGDGSLCLPNSKCGNGGPARDAALDTPVGVAVDGNGDVYIADQAANQVREVSPAGRIRLIAGTGRRCSAAPNCGDGGRAIRARLAGPWGVAVDAAGNLYIADYLNNEVRRVSPRGMISRFAGDGRQCSRPGRCGDGGAATHARLFNPAGVAVDRARDVYIADSNDHEVRKVSPQGTVTRFAGNGGGCSSVRACGDGRRAVSASVGNPFGVAVAQSGSVYITDIEGNDVREVDPSGIITRIAGSGRQCSSAPRCGDGSHPTAARLTNPTAVAVDAARNVYIADSADHEVREIVAR